jgi:glycosyltransferase involved in cell wall biosynthesis
LVNDGSKEDLRAIKKQILNDSRFILINQKNKGLSGARNTGLKKAKGKYVQFIDADDLLSRNKIKNGIRILEENDSIDVVLSDYIFCCDNKKIRTQYILKDIFREIVIHNFIVINSAIIRKSTEKKAKWFNENLKAMEDWQFWVRIIMRKSLIALDPNRNSYAIVRDRKDSLSKKNGKMTLGNKYTRKWISRFVKKADLKIINFIRLKKTDYIDGIYKLKIGTIRLGISLVIKSFPFVVIDKIFVRQNNK